MQQPLSDLYRKHRRRYVPGVIALGGAFGASAWLITALIGSHVLGLGSGAGAEAAAAVEVTLVPAFALALLHIRGDLRTLHGWVVDGSPADETGRAGLLRTAIRLPGRASAAVSAAGAAAADGRPRGWAEAIDEGLQDLDHALTELRDLARGTYPAVLASGGLGAALALATEGAAIEARLDCDGLGRYEPELEAAIYFCCLEALQNTAKHAGKGAAVEVSLVEGDGELLFELTDGGRGFIVATNGAEAGIGMQSMEDRIGALDGELKITSAPGKGTRVTGRVPIAGSLNDPS